MKFLFIYILFSLSFTVECMGECNYAIIYDDALINEADTLKIFIIIKSQMNSN